MSFLDATNFGVKSGDMVALQIDSLQRKTIFKDVLVKVNANYVLSAHIDFDEANASGCFGNIYGKIIF
jgi:propanediol utilization protein